MSELEQLLLLEIEAAELPAPVCQFKAIADRRFRWDFAYPDEKLLIEVQGGTWVAHTGHTSGRGVARDCEKVNIATLHGWRVLMFTGDMVNDGTAIKTIAEAIGRKG